MKIKSKDVAVGFIYLTTASQYRAVLAMKDDFMIYAPSLEGASLIDIGSAKMPFENQPFKKCQIITFAKKDYQEFVFNGVRSLKHKLSQAQLVEIVAQCNAKVAIAEL